MSGYRDTSGYDPYAYERPGRPLRPYNWVQWIGVAIIVGGAAICFIFLLGEIGVIPKFTGKSVLPFAYMPMIGMTLVNSRREPGTPVDDLQRQRNKRILAITVAVCAVILGVATIFALKGY